MYILDTDHLSLIQRNGQEGKRILARLATIADLSIAVAVIGYQRLEQLIADYQSISIIPFSNAAALEHQRLRKAYPRLGNMDLKIAATSLTNNAILLTRNTSDFEKIVELRIEDWSMT